jgi:hypothetical protein
MSARLIAKSFPNKNTHCASGNSGKAANVGNYRLTRKNACDCGVGLPPPAAYVETQGGSLASRFRARRNSFDDGDAFAESEIGARKVSGAHARPSPTRLILRNPQLYTQTILFGACFMVSELEFISPGWRWVRSWPRGLRRHTPTSRSARAARGVGTKSRGTSPRQTDALQHTHCYFSDFSLTT